jgi:hypothetical protein
MLTSYTLSPPQIDLPFHDIFREMLKRQDAINQSYLKNIVFYLLLSGGLLSSAATGTTWLRLSSPLEDESEML